MSHTVAPPPEPRSRLDAFKVFLASTASLFGLIVLAPLRRGKLRALWSSHVPGLAAAIAKMIDKAPDLFKWVPQSAAWFRQAVDAIDELTEVHVACTQFAERVNDTMIQIKSDLYSTVNLTVRGLTSMIESPATPPDVRGRLLEVSEEVRAILDKRNAALSAARNEAAASEEAARIAELEAKLAEKDRELRVLRGQPVEPAPTPGKKGRKARKSPR